MKLALLYLRVLGRSDGDAKEPSHYSPYEERFARTFVQYKPRHQFDFIVCTCGSEPKNDFYGLDHIRTQYIGPGWDIGAYQAVVPKMDYDFVICCNSAVHFREYDWLDPLVSAFEKYGHGVYAPMGSYENHPHLRTPCIVISPSVFRRYPLRIACRDESQHFESGVGNIALWSISQNIPALMVTRKECLTVERWREPENIFMRGDQSNCLVWDRHNDMYHNADHNTKRLLEMVADGKAPRSIIAQ